MFDTRAWRLSLLPLVLALCISNYPALAQEDQGDAMLRQAQPYLEQKRYDEASRILWKAASVAPQNASVQYNLGVAFTGLKRDRDAWTAFAKAAQLDPTDVRSQIEVARSYARCGDKKHATQILRDCQQKLHPNADDQKEIVLLLARFTEGSAQTAQIVNALNSHPEDVSSWMMLARNYKESGKPEEAVKAMKSCLARFPKDASVQKSLAYYLLDAGHYKESIAQYEESNKITSDPHSYENMMYCQSKLGDLDGLQRSRKKFVELFPNNADAKRVQDEVVFYDNDFARTREREASGGAGDYAAFKNMQMPIKIFVHDRLSGRTVWSAEKASGPEKINYSLMVDRALDAWSDASRKRVSFIFVDNAAHCNIECEWTADRNKLHYSFAGGVTSYSSNVVGQPKATIHLLSTCHDSNEFFEIVLHELGHALGLKHSSSPADVMYFSGQTRADKKAATQLSSHDVERIRQLYGS